MVRFLMIFLTFVLITASAAMIGLEIPSDDVLILNEDVPVESEESSSSKETLDDPPRFIPDEEIADDPSASQKNEETTVSDSSPKIPTEREIRKAAEPYISEINSIKENAFANLGSMEKKIAVDYLSLPQKERENAPQKLMEKYIPAAKLLLETADRDVERALKKLEAALTAINAPLDTAEKVRAGYKKDKQETISSYNELLKSMGQEINLDEALKP